MSTPLEAEIKTGEEERSQPWIGYAIVAVDREGPVRATLRRNIDKKEIPVACITALRSEAEEVLADIKTTRFTDTDGEPGEIVRVRIVPLVE